jgi:hypothetical protein
MCNTYESHRILITPNVAAPYDQWMVKEMAAAFNALGHFAAAMPSPQSAVEILALIESFSIDVVIQINRTRDPDVPFPPHVRHVSWYQDVFPETLDGFVGNFNGSDILYALGDPAVLGLNIQPDCLVGSLFTGVDQSVMNFRPKQTGQELDFSLCGGLPHPVDLPQSLMADLLCHFDQKVRRSPRLGRSKLTWIVRKLIFGPLIPVNYVPYPALLAMRNIVEGFYRPLRGELDIHQLAEAMWKQGSLFVDLFEEIPQQKQIPAHDALTHPLRAHVQNMAGRRDAKAKLVKLFAGGNSFFQPSIRAAIERAISYFSQSYPRIMDREVLVRAAASVSDSLALYGPGLAAHNFARPYYKGVINDKHELLQIYSRSKINLSNNTHGLGLHSRVLECMAIGGFIFMHESPHDNKAGGMLTAFEPDIHFGAYTPDNFPEQARRWLGNEGERRKVGENARKIIQQSHRWQHRAQQILDDLKR